MFFKACLCFCARISGIWYASFNAQSVKGNDMACKRCEISTFIKDNGVNLNNWCSG